MAARSLTAVLAMTVVAGCGATGGSAPDALRDALDAAAAGMAEFHAIDGTGPRDEEHLAAETAWQQDPDFPVRIVDARDDGSYCLESAPAEAWAGETSYGLGPGVPDANRTWHLTDDGDLGRGRCPA